MLPPDSSTTASRAPSANRRGPVRNRTATSMIAVQTRHERDPRQGGQWRDQLQEGRRVDIGAGLGPVRVGVRVRSGGSPVRDGLHGPCPSGRPNGWASSDDHQPHGERRRPGRSISADGRRDAIERRDGRAVARDGQLVRADRSYPGGVYGDRGGWRPGRGADRTTYVCTGDCTPSADRRRSTGVRVGWPRAEHRPASPAPAPPRDVARRRRMRSCPIDVAAPDIIEAAGLRWIHIESPRIGRSGLARGAVRLPPARLRGRLLAQPATQAGPVRRLRVHRPALPAVRQGQRRGS